MQFLVILHREGTVTMQRLLISQWKSQTYCDDAARIESPKEKGA